MAFQKPSGKGGFLRGCAVIKLVARGRIELPTYGFHNRYSVEYEFVGA